jgi:hypothetical protein
VTTEQSFVRTIEDLVETVRVIAQYFQADEVFIIGSQSILLSWPDAPIIMRTSGEIDAYPGNAKLWEIEQKQLDPSDDPEASEEINALYGAGSPFHKNHGFYIDGVDENTARLPLDWRERAISKLIKVGEREVLAIAPCPEDIIVSKLARLAEKDKEFITAYHEARPLNLALIKERLKATNFEPEISARALVYLTSLAKG